MAAQVTRRALVRWLLDQGFELGPGKASGHSHYIKNGHKITVVAHGPQDLTKKALALTVRQLEAAGYGKDLVLRELGVRR